MALSLNNVSQQVPQGIYKFNSAKVWVPLRAFLLFLVQENWFVAAPFFNCLCNLSVQCQNTPSQKEENDPQDFKISISSVAHRPLVLFEKRRWQMLTNDLYMWLIFANSYLLSWDARKILSILLHLNQKPTKQSVSVQLKFRMWKSLDI